MSEDSGKTLDPAGVERDAAKVEQTLVNTKRRVRESGAPVPSGGLTVNKTQEEFRAEPMFDYGPGERPPFGGRERVPTASVKKSRAGIGVDERLAALEKNPHFVCLGCRNGEYFFRSKRVHERITTRNFSRADILRLAPLEFWEEWSGTKGKRFPQIEIMDELIRLSQRTGRFVYPYERWLAAESATR